MSGAKEKGGRSKVKEASTDSGEVETNSHTVLTIPARPVSKKSECHYSRLGKDKPDKLLGMFAAELLRTAVGQKDHQCEKEFLVAKSFINFSCSI